MATVTVKNIPPDIYERLKKSAAASHRSINSEIIAAIEKAVRCQPIQPEQTIESARRLRLKTLHYQITDLEFEKAVNNGRS